MTAVARGFGHELGTRQVTVRFTRRRAPAPHPERPGEPLGVQRLTIGSAECEAGISEAGAHDQPLGQLLLAMPAQNCNRALIQGDRTPAACSLR